jgi:hypothetical protein
LPTVDSNKLQVNVNIMLSAEIFDFINNYGSGTAHSLLFEFVFNFSSRNSN